jgi:5-methylcytosine-specific restriction enzyme A
MARTQGHGNPDWTRDETMLALSLYFECGETVPSKTDPRVQELSGLLRRLPYHADAAKKSTFRNPDGVRSNSTISGAFLRRPRTRRG